MSQDSTTIIKQINIVSKDALRKLKSGFDNEAITILHCTYVSKPQYQNGGWVSLYPNTCLVNPVDRSELKLQHAFNIPFFPTRFYFKKAGDIKRFTLYFPPIPKHWSLFHLIEQEGDSPFFSCNIERNSSGIYQILF